MHAEQPVELGLKVFSATTPKLRNELGEVVTEWLRANPDIELLDRFVTQSSDNDFHCLTITIFYRAGKPRRQR